MKKKVCVLGLALLAYCLIGALVAYNESAIQALASMGCIFGAMAGKVSTL